MNIHGYKQKLEGTRKKIKNIDFELDVLKKQPKAERDEIRIEILRNARKEIEDSKPVLRQKIEKLRRKKAQKKRK